MLRSFRFNLNCNIPFDEIMNQRVPQEVTPPLSSLDKLKHLPPFLFLVTPKDIYIGVKSLGQISWSIGKNIILGSRKCFRDFKSKIRDLESKKEKIVEDDLDLDLKKIVEDDLEDDDLDLDIQYYELDLKKRILKDGKSFFINSSDEMFTRLDHDHEVFHLFTILNNILNEDWDLVRFHSFLFLTKNFRQKPEGDQIYSDLPLSMKKRLFNLYGGNSEETTLLSRFQKFLVPKAKVESGTLVPYGQYATYTFLGSATTMMGAKIIELESRLRLANLEKSFIQQELDAMKANKYIFDQGILDLETKNRADAFFVRKTGELFIQFISGNVVRISAFFFVISFLYQFRSLLNWFFGSERKQIDQLINVINEVLAIFNKNLSINSLNFKKIFSLLSTNQDYIKKQQEDIANLNKDLTNSQEQQLIELKKQVRLSDTKLENCEKASLEVLSEISDLMKRCIHAIDGAVVDSFRYLFSNSSEAYVLSEFEKHVRSGFLALAGNIKQDFLQQIAVSLLNIANSTGGEKVGENVGENILVHVLTTVNETLLNSTADLKNVSTTDLKNVENIATEYKNAFMEEGLQKILKLQKSFKKLDQEEAEED